jgi:hypothetical protein
MDPRIPAGSEGMLDYVTEHPKVVFMYRFSGGYNRPSHALADRPKDSAGNLSAGGLKPVVPRKWPVNLKVTDF